MTRREYLQEQYEDALFALLMDDLALAEGKLAIEEHDRLMNDPNAAVPEHIVRHSLRTIRSHFAYQRRHTVRRMARKVISRAAMVVLVGTLLFTTAFAVSDNFRINTLNYVIEFFGDRAAFYVDSETSTMPKTIEAQWLPEGYKLIDFNRNDEAATALFQTQEEEEITVRIFDARGYCEVDTEDAEVGMVFVNGYEAVTIAKQAIDGLGQPLVLNRVIWVDTEYGWYIDVRSSDKNMESLIKFVENLSIK